MMNIKTILHISFKGAYYFLFNKHFRSLMWLFLFNSNQNRYQTKSLKVNGLKLRIPDGISFAWQYYEIFFNDFYRFKTTNEAPRIIDCGANVGLSCLYYLEQYPKASIVAFEASPFIAKFLKTNLVANKGSSVEVIEKAVWIHNDGIGITEDKSDNSSISEDGTLKVESINLSEFLANEKKVDFLKMDIEGAEVAVVKACADQLHKVENVFIEYHSFVAQKQELSVILNLLEAQGFRYHVENAKNLRAPFINHKADSGMDLQINIFGWRKG